MIYFDNASTSWPKPRSVIAAVADSMKHLAANPGRSGHKMAIEAGEKVFECREEIASFFGLSDPCRVIFTLNATHALNIVINGILNNGDHVIYTQMAHNSVQRPVWAKRGEIQITSVPAKADGSTDIASVEKAIKPDTKLIIITHASNVCGTYSDLGEYGKLAKKHNVKLLVDASQSAGILDINMERDNIDFLAMPGHKALYGPMGTGVLCINTSADLKPLMCGGTGSYSHELNQPRELPDLLESGTLNFPGICGLLAGIRFVKALGANNIYKHEMKLTEFLLNEISELGSYSVVGRGDLNKRLGVVSVVCKSHSSAELAEYLNTDYNIAARALFHCSYSSHVALGTQQSGTLRISFGVFNTIGQLKTLLYALEHIA